MNINDPNLTIQRVAAHVLSFFCYFARHYGHKIGKFIRDRAVEIVFPLLMLKKHLESTINIIFVEFINTEI